MRYHKIFIYGAEIIKCLQKKTALASQIQQNFSINCRLLIFNQKYFHWEMWRKKWKRTQRKVSEPEPVKGCTPSVISSGLPLSDVQNCWNFGVRNGKLWVGKGWRIGTCQDISFVPDVTFRVFKTCENFEPFRVWVGSSAVGSRSCEKVEEYPANRRWSVAIF